MFCWDWTIYKAETILKDHIYHTKHIYHVKHFIERSSVTNRGTKKWLPSGFSIFDGFYSFFSWSGNANVKFNAW